MASPEQHKCLSCGEMFRADPRNAKHQKYCSEGVCRKASKAASRRAWCAKPENEDYFRGPENVARVQSWRAAHPGYWRRAKGQRAKQPQSSLALQDLCPSQVLEISKEPQEVLQAALQDHWREQPAVLIGFLAQFTGSALQDDIARITRRLLELGHDILAGRIGDDPQTCALFRAGADGPDAVQLGGSPAGSRRHIERCDPPAAALYLFLVTVADGQGLSYYADAALARRLSMSATRLNQARGDLVRVGLVAWQRPLYQVLALESPPGSAARELDADEIGIRIGRLHAALGRTP